MIRCPTMYSALIPSSPYAEPKHDPLHALDARAVCLPERALCDHPISGE
jgi:hypothetical protein